MQSAVLAAPERQGTRAKELRLNQEFEVIAFVGASGSGKSTMMSQLLIRFSSSGLKPVMSWTTRAPRSSDQVGEYGHLTHAEWQEMKDLGAFAWSVDLHHARYGTRYVDLKTGSLRVMHLEPSSVPKLVEVVPTACLIFLTAPADTLNQRLRARDPGKTNGYYDERVQTCLTWEADARRSKEEGKINYRFVANLDNHFAETVQQVLEIATTK